MTNYSKHPEWTQSLENNVIKIYIKYGLFTKYTSQELLEI